MSEEICPSINKHCNQKEKKCDKCISQEEAWKKINCYIECHDYLKKLYCNPIILDIIEHNKNECKLLFEE